MLARKEHEEYLLPSLGTMSAAFEGYGASLPWVAYWTTHSLDLLQALPDDSEIRDKVGREQTHQLVCSLRALGNLERARCKC